MLDEVEFNSIINENSVLSEVTDTLKPYTFIEYISKANILNSETNFLKDYKEYIKEWVLTKNSNTGEVELNKLIQAQIIALLKIIVISYSSYEEQLFLSNLNWDFDSITDEKEKEDAKNTVFSALPIFVSRIKEIINFYNQKRTEATFVIERNKIRGTQNSVEKIIYDNVIDYLFNNTQTAELNRVKNYFNLNIERYVDTYSEYFDLDRSKSPTSEYNDIDATIYFELSDILSKMLFSGEVYLREIPLIAQLSIDLNDECVGDKLTLKNELLEDSKLSLISNEEKINLRRKLYKKYLGVDFYYFYKSLQGNIEQGVFIKADNPTGNLLNQQAADTPFTESKQLELLKNIGLFFKPDKMSILRVNTNNYEYVIDEDKVEAGQLYIFPDPNIYGNVAFNNRVKYPYILQYSLNEYTKNLDYGWVNKDPKVLGDQQAVFSYYSKEQDLDKLNENNKVKLGFEDLYNRGYISTYKEDLYNNKFALIKEQDGTYARNWNIKSLSNEVTDNTINSWQDGEEDKNYEDGDTVDSSLFYLLVDGGTLDGTAQAKDKGISADKSTWTNTDHYYEYFIEAGLSTKVPEYKRAYILDGATVGNGDLRLKVDNDKDFTWFINGGYIDTDYSVFEDPEMGDVIPKVYGVKDEYLSNILPDSCQPNAESKTYFELEKTKGDLYITRPNKSSDLLINVLPWWKQGSDINIYKFFNDNIVDFDIIENIIWAKAIDPNDGSVHYMFDNFVYDNLTDTFSKKFNNKQTIFFTKQGHYDAFNYKTLEEKMEDYFGGNNQIYDYGSNIFYIEKEHKIYFVIMDMEIVSIDTPNGSIYYPIYRPDLYCLDIINYNIIKYTFKDIEESIEQKAESFKIPENLYNDASALIFKPSPPHLTYSADNDTFMLTYIAYDVNLTPYLYKHYFKVDKPINDYSGILTQGTLDSTVYSPSYTNEATVITPGDDITVLTKFDTNLILD